MLWFQEQAIRGKVTLHKVEGTRNQADLMTKHLDANKIQEHVDRMPIGFKTRRSDRAANLYSIDDAIPGTRELGPSSPQAGWKEKQGEGNDEADDNGSDDGDKQGGEDSTIRGGRQYDWMGETVNQTDGYAGDAI